MAEPIYYDIKDDRVIAVSKYNGHQDIAITLQKSGPNHLFDFYDMSFIENTQPQVSHDTSYLPSRYSCYGVGTDWHMPFIVRAVENGDGDHPEKRYYTGGNHGYDNTFNMEVSATGRTVKYTFLADGFPVTEGSGTCSRLEVRWTNRIQGYNTTKADGTGREILEENHIMSFDGKEWNSYVELIPLETVCMETWYCFGCNYIEKFYPHVRFPGGKNREENGCICKCGNKDCYRVEMYGDEDKIILELDPMFDLGKRELYGGNDGAYSTYCHKAYFNVISSDTDESLRTWKAGQMYTARGKYIFEANY